jgi:hypothetical protein
MRKEQGEVNSLAVTCSVDIEAPAKSGATYRISVSHFNGKPTVGLENYSVSIALQDLEQVCTAMKQAAAAWTNIQDTLKDTSGAITGNRSSYTVVDDLVVDMEEAC